MFKTQSGQVRGRIAAIKRPAFILLPVLLLCLLTSGHPVVRDMMAHGADIGMEPHSPSVSEQEYPITAQVPSVPPDPYLLDCRRTLELLSGYEAAGAVDEDFLIWGRENVAADFAARLADRLEAEGYTGGTFYELFGETLHVLRDRRANEAEHSADIRVTEAGDAVTLAFAGDVNLADNWENMQAYRARSGGVEGAISAPLLERMRGADILLVNNEFCFSDRGAPIPGKQYTFRSAVENVQLYGELGVDIVSLANNHVFDYGNDAFYDTLNTLSGADIPYVGAGRDISEAMRVQYFHAGGMKIAYIAAAQIEAFMFTPPATADTPGVLPCFDGGSLTAAVAAARENADWVIVYLHWGIEYDTSPGRLQVNLAHELADIGADIVVGAHPHVLQGIEFYDGKPIAYSLGNFWFNVGWVNTALLEIELSAPGRYRMYVLPCATAQGTVRLMEEDSERRSLFAHLERISDGITIADDGKVYPDA